MNQQQYAELVITKQKAEEAWRKDPNNKVLFDAYYEACERRNQGMRQRQEQMCAEKYPVVQFERKPDEGLLNA